MARNKVTRPAAAEIIDPTPPTVKDPVEEAGEYVSRHWLQQLTAVRTQCYRCAANSPIVHVPLGTIAFGNPLRRNEVDITEEVVIAFATIGWRFQKRKSYCPTCKGLGQI